LAFLQLNRVIGILPLPLRKKLKPGEQLQQTILKALDQAKTSAEWAKEGGQYIPHPATWLNAKGWEDEQGLPGVGDWKQQFLEGSAS